MLYTIPDYYEAFSCTADACEDTCCAGWQIVVDEEALERYRAEKGPYRKKLREAICWRDGTFRQDPLRRCKFLKEDNLCEMYQQLGADSRCKTCRTYPRHTEEFEGVREISLSLSCPEVTRMLVGRQEPVEFLNYEKEGEEEFDGFDPFLYSYLVDTRDLMLITLKNRRLPVENRMMLMLGMAHDLEERVKKGALFSCGDVLDTYRKETYFSAAARKAERYKMDWKRRYTFSRRTFAMIRKLELLQPEWKQMRTETSRILFSGGWRGYRNLHKEFARAEVTGFDREILTEQLLVYFIFTYFCGAVYDEKIFVNAQMAAGSVALIWDFLAARWLKNGKTLNQDDVIEVIYRYSRELEHSDKNLKKIWKLLEKQAELYR